MQIKVERERERERAQENEKESYAILKFGEEGEAKATIKTERTIWCVRVCVSVAYWFRCVCVCVNNLSEQKQS